MTGNKSSNKKELIAKEHFSEWYDNVLLEAKLIDDRYPVKGFSVYTGWGMSIAKRIIRMLEEKLEENGNEPMQFPVVIPEDSFQKEADHIEGFSGEVFWITHAGNNELDRRLLLRPTSETAIYPMFKLWIRVLISFLVFIFVTGSIVITKSVTPNSCILSTSLRVG